MSDYKDSEYGRRAYWQEGKTLKEIGGECGCAGTTVGKWRAREGRKRRGSGRGGDKEGSITLSHIRSYEVFQTRVDYEAKQIYHHRLLAVAEYGFEEVCQNVVHHENGIEWDNRPGNIQLLGDSEHKSMHAKEREVNDQGEFI